MADTVQNRLIRARWALEFLFAEPGRDGSGAEFAADSLPEFLNALFSPEQRIAYANLIYRKFGEIPLESRLASLLFDFFIENRILPKEAQKLIDDGILREMRPQIEDSNDGVQFKGIFIRHLAFLYDITKNPAYKDFIVRNAESIVARDYDAATRSFGCYWYGPFHRAGAAANACALECVIEAYRLTR